MFVLIVVGSWHGHTARIAERIAEVLRSRGHHVDLRHGKELPPNFVVAPYDAIIVGDAIHMGRYDTHILEFVRRHRDALETHPSAFFNSCLAAATPTPDKHNEVLGYLDELTKTTHWRPPLRDSFAGALDYPNYGWLLGLLMRRIARQERLDTDTKQAHEYTDWNQVEAFAHSFDGLLCEAVDSPPLLRAG